MLQPFPSAIVQHSIPGRVRIRISDRRGDSEYFERAERVMSAGPGVATVAANPLTGSLLIEFEGSLERVLEHASSKGIFSLTSSARPSDGPFTRLDNELERFDQKVRRASHGRWGTSGLAFYGAIAASAVQFGKGNVLPPAVSLLLYSFDLYMKARDAERVASQK